MTARQSKAVAAVYFHRIAEALETLLGRQLEESEREVRSVADVLCRMKSITRPTIPFTSLIGYDRSLRDAVEKAVRRLLYPHGFYTRSAYRAVRKTFCGDDAPFRRNE